MTALDLGAVAPLAFGLYRDLSRPFVIINAFIDESGTHGAPHITMGAIVATAAQWDSFDREWNGMRAEFEIPYYHSKKLWQSKTPFKNWSVAKKQALLDRLFEILKHSAYGFSVKLLLSDYQEAYKSGPALRKVQLDSAYGICFRSVMYRVVHELPAGTDHSLNFILELGANNFGDCKRIFREMKKDYGPEIGGMIKTFDGAERQDFAGLQAADFLAYRSWQFGRSVSDVPLVELIRAAEVRPKLARWEGQPYLTRTLIKPMYLRFLKGYHTLLHHLRVIKRSDFSKIAGVVERDADSGGYKVVFRYESRVLCEWPVPSFAKGQFDIQAMNSAIESRKKRSE